MKRGQVSIEFITVFGFIFLMMIPLIIIFFDQSGNVQDAIAENHIRNIEIKITDKAETVYYSGEPSKATFKAYFPERIESISINSRRILFGYRRWKGDISTIEYTSLVNISGSLSTNPGIHYIEIEAMGEGVSING
jgi:hypothetical protein